VKRHKLLARLGAEIRKERLQAGLRIEDVIPKGMDPTGGSKLERGVTGSIWLLLEYVDRLKYRLTLTAKETERK
jgi:hypothetical protein